MAAGRHENPAYNRGHIHWRAPSSMIGFLLAGCLCALSHHLLNQSLNGREASNETHSFAGWKLSGQQLTVTAGTAFAFAVKASLVLAVAGSYAQLMFRAILDYDLRVAELDNLFGSLGSVISFVSIAHQFRLLPLATVFAPSSLTVSLAMLEPSPTEMLQVPVPAFSSLAFSKQNLGYMNISSYFGPVAEVQRVAVQTAASGSILPILPPVVNASWDVSFEGPSLSCNRMNDIGVQAVKHNMLNIFNQSTHLSQEITRNKPKLILNSVDWMFSYLAWYGDDGALPLGNPNGDQSQWKINDRDDLRVSFSNMMIGVFPNNLIRPIPNTSFDVLSICNGARGCDSTSNQASGLGGWHPWNNDTIMNWFFEGATLIECKPMLASYALHFGYDGPDAAGNQQIEILNLTLLDRMKGEVSFECNKTKTGNLVLVAPDAASTEGLDSLNDNGFVDGRVLSRLSSMAIFKSFYELFKGSINMHSLMRADTGWSKGGGYDRTNVFSTVIAETKEFQPLINRTASPSDLTGEARGKAFDEISALFGPREEGSDAKDLISAIEQLFQNVTISMASVPSLRYKESNPFRTEDVLVTSSVYRNLYRYAPLKLWIPYGLGICTTALAVMSGLLSIFTLRASFTANFSTILRISRRAQLPANASENDLAGEDPLPKSLGRARLRIKPVAEKGSYRPVIQTSDEDSGSGAMSSGA